MTHGLAELAGNATLLTGGVATQSVLTTETGRDGTFFEGVVDSVTNVQKGIVSVKSSTIDPA